MYVCMYVCMSYSCSRKNANLNAESHPSANAMNAMIGRSIGIRERRYYLPCLIKP